MTEPHDHRLKNWFYEWVKPATLVFAGTLICSFAVLFYRVKTVETNIETNARANSSEHREIIRNAAKADDVVRSVEVSRARMESDILYIKLRLDEIVIDLREKKINP